MMRPTFYLVMLMLALAPLPALADLVGPPVVVKKSQVRDLSAIRSSKVLRVLVNQSRNSSGQVPGEEIGVEYHRLSAFEQYLNSHSRDGKQLTLKIIPKSKDQLLAALQRGEGDLVAPGELLDMSAARAVNASAPIVSHVPLIVVGIKGDRSFKHIEQLSGRTITLATGSAADNAVDQLNQKLGLRKLPPVKIEWVDPSLAVEDVLEMVQAGVYHLTVVEQPIAERWVKVMPKLRVERSLVLSNSGDMNWYVRQDATMLRASIDRFIKQYQAPAGEDFAFEQAYQGQYQLHYPL
ncbi:transporter substrate-binding domain-containing protein, partial [Pseudomonas sp. CCC3.2]